jgi:hypothetical protein
MPTPMEWLRPCPYCSATHCVFVPITGSGTSKSATGEDRVWQIAACPACGGAIVAELAPNGRVMDVQPKATGRWDVAGLPDAVERDWNETVTAYGAKVDYLAVVGCRRTLEAAADARGVTRGNLASRISQEAAVEPQTL